MDSDSESKLISLISQLRCLGERTDPEWESEIMSLIIQIISLVRSMDLGDSQSKPQSKLMSLITQTASLFNSLDFDYLPKPLLELISLISQRFSGDSNQEPESDLNFTSLVDQTLQLKQGHEIILLIRQIVSVAMFMDPKLKKLISLCPQVQGYFDEGEKFSVRGEESIWSSDLWNCFLGIFDRFGFKGEEDFTHFYCRGCNGEYHKEYEKAPLKIKHPLHPKHSLKLALNMGSVTRDCYCCDENLIEVFYYCSACDCAMNIVCVDKRPVLSIPPPKWHEHTLSLFPRQASLTCNVCALADSSSPIYMCPPCDFVVHLRCINLPRVIRISRHPHRIYTISFDEEDRSCGVCHRKIDNDYGGYSCITDGCSYAVHSRCATQSNVWDGIDLEGEPEEIEEEKVEPFVRINDGIIQHFSHEHHHLRLDENTCGDYEENRQCQACVTPIYSGNFYSCMQCEFILHETCANLSRNIYHPIHPHLLTLALVGESDDVMDHYYGCSACYMFLKAGFFYECGKEGCFFRLHVQCATIDEPLVHESHKQHPLFLTSKPGERRICSVCLGGGEVLRNETFNCVDECDVFALCFKCATLPQKVRYKHDKHILTLSYGQEETKTLTYWCEACETKINPKERFYMCDEYCSVTLHMECLIGRDLYMKPGSSFSDYRRQVSVLPNNHHMSRPICFKCKSRCSQKIVFQCSGSVFCSLKCLGFFFY